MKKIGFILLCLSGVSAFAATKISFVSCLKAYKDAETKQKEKECAPLAKSLSSISSDKLKLEAKCVSGPEVFNTLGCGAYDVALVGSGESSVEPPSDISLNICFKAYSDEETKQAEKKCESLSKSLNKIDSTSISFTTSCISGRDSFFKYNCGLYDAVLLGKSSLK